MRFLTIIKYLFILLLFNSCEGVNKGEISFQVSEMNASKSIELDLAKNQRIIYVLIHKAKYIGTASLRVNLDVYYKDSLIREHHIDLVDNSFLFGSSIARGGFNDDVFESAGKYKFTVTPICAGDITVTKLLLKINKK